MRGPIKGNVRRTFLLWCYRNLLYFLAYIWRRLLFRTTFIAITGSVGKTTAKECIAAILSSRSAVVKTLYNRNDHYGVPRTILQTRPWHRFAIVEIGTGRPGRVGKLSHLARPDVAIVLAVARTHTNEFATLEDTAAEKAQILEAVPPDGLAILNADDPRVLKMAENCRCKVKTFGSSGGLDLWADEVSSKWPARLTFRAHTESEELWVKTNLVGEHWVSSAMAALLTAVVCGIPPKTAAAELEKVQPFMARMQPVTLPNGATFIRDEKDGSPDSLQAALKVLKESDAVRRVLVMSDISDSRERPRVRLKRLGKIASQVTDIAIFIGEHGNHGAEAAIKSGMKPECAHSFTDIYRAALYLKSELRSGDLVLLKGRATDHLSRVFFAQLGDIGCWKIKCHKLIVCDICEELQPEFDCGIRAYPNNLFKVCHAERSEASGI